MNKLVIGKNPIPENFEEIFREQIVNKELQMRGKSL
jgi:hypothetical protein